MLGVQSAILQRLADARRETDELFDIVRPGAIYERPIPERHRIIFYIGHLETFDWNLLRDRLLGVEPFAPELDRLFAFGIDPVGGGLPNDEPSDWPSLPQVREYNRHLRETIDDALEKIDLSNGSQTDREFPAAMLLNVAIEHRLMHAETLCYMLHQLALTDKIPPPRPPAKVANSQIKQQMIEIPEGKATLGLPRGETSRFGWDNEYNEHQVTVPGFLIDKYKVTNGDYLNFVNADGYNDQSLWTDADWKWRSEREIEHPVFWRKTGGSWLYRSMFEEIPLPLDWPVYVSQAEASAFARWSGKSLPTEAQWHRAAYGTPTGDEREYPWGDEAPEESSSRGNFNFAGWDPMPVDAFPEGQSAFGVTDLLGNGWEWTSTIFAPFEGFRPFPFYPGYSADFFDGKHHVMKGGSARTAACMLRRSFRNWFQSHYQYVYAGFRCVSPASM
jgi:gamma-glutamyl hercynylcysteine S-oxide synthase